MSEYRMTKVNYRVRIAMHLARSDYFAWKAAKVNDQLMALGEYNSDFATMRVQFAAQMIKSKANETGFWLEVPLDENGDILLTRKSLT